MNWDKWGNILKGVLIVMVAIAVIGSGVVYSINHWPVKTVPVIAGIIPETIKAETSMLATPVPTEVVKEEEKEESVEIVPTEVVLVAGLPGTSTIVEISRSADALDYPEIVAPNAGRQVVFPDVPYKSKPALAAYESPFEDGDYCDNTPCGMDVPQYYYRVMTAGEVTIPKLNVSCVATSTKGCLVIVVNHFGPTAMFRGNTIDHGFTIAGRVWNMERPVNVSVVSQALLDHYVYRMSTVPYGANCSTIDACETVEWHLVVIGDGESQAHWSGLFRR